MDLRILLWIQSNLRTDWLDNLMPSVTALGSGGFIWIVISIFLVVQKKYRYYGAAILAALILSSLIGDYCLKPLVARARPYNAIPGVSLLIPRLRDYSFPSGHAMSSFSAATVIFRIDKRLGTPAFILATLIAFSRLYLFMHYPSDVLAGAVLGVLVGLFVYWGTNRMVPFKQDIQE